MRKMGWLVIVGMMAWGCGTTRTLQPPEGMRELAAASNSGDLAERFYPGKRGQFFAVSDDPNSPLFGVLFDGDGGDKAYLVGAGVNGSWSEVLPLEGAHRKVTGVRALRAALGDVRRDGTGELLLQVEVESVPREGHVKQVRHAVYLYELAKRANLVLYRSLSLEGEDDCPCTGGSVDYTAQVRFTVERGRVEQIETTYDTVRKVCKGGKGCKKKQRTCSGDRNSGVETLIWDGELRTYRPETSTESVLKIPDVTL